MPLANCLHRRVHKDWVTRNSLQFGDGTVVCKNYDEFNYPLCVGESSFAWVNGAHRAHVKATKLVLREMNAMRDLLPCKTWMNRPSKNEQVHAQGVRGQSLCWGRIHRPRLRLSSPDEKRF
jgi:hypothetical protein